MSFNFAPTGWAQCNGQLLPINQNQALFSLLGTTYGGDGRVNFALPDLRGRVPMYIGNGHVLGERGGEQSHTLTTSELPAHTHSAQAVAGNVASNAATPIPTGAYPASANNTYGSATALTALDPSSVTSLGGTQAHLNMQPFLALTFCISITGGIFPSQT